ncbi:hypothetical protein GQ54DRAFT_157567 [Martensiomyces pterosporus]|nr:hypothetical protein GQ54DRAFT_157567 [Martensiomyces pterosporus]
MPLATPKARQLRSGGLRDTRNFARLSHFLHLFHTALNVETFEIERLEAELCQVDDSSSPLIRQVAKRALRTLTGNRNIDENRLEHYIARAWERYYADAGSQAHALPESFEELGLFGIGVGDRVRVVLETCELVFCRPDNFRSIGCVARMDPQMWRVAPLGVDDLNRTYWLLCDSRLYRETPKQIADLLLADDGGGGDEQAQHETEKKSSDWGKKGENADAGPKSLDSPESNGGTLRRRSTRISAQTAAAAAAQAEAQAKAAAARPRSSLPSREMIEFADPPRHRMREECGDLWEILCVTADEWDAFPQVFSRSKSKSERSLYKALATAAPGIVGTLHAAARRRQMQAAVAHRKRSSRIAMKELYHQEELHKQVEQRRQLDEQQALAEGRRASKRLRSQRDGETAASDAVPPVDSHDALVKNRNIRAQRREKARRQAMESAAVAKSLSEIAGKASGLRESTADAAGAEEDQEEEDDWMFSCSCGKSGHNYDDGRAMTACEECGVWRHLGCALRGEAQRVGREIDEDDWESIRYVCPQCLSSAVAAIAAVTTTTN